MFLSTTNRVQQQDPWFLPRTIVIIFLIWGAQICGVHGGKQKGGILTLNQLNKILRTEASNEFGGEGSLHNVDNHRRHRRWTRAVIDEWELATNRQEFGKKYDGHKRFSPHYFIFADAENRRLSRNKATAGMSPFVVCDLNKHAEINSSNQRLLLVEKTVFSSGSSMNSTPMPNPNLMPIYNKADMTCFVTQALPSKFREAPQGLVMAPLTPEMKMGEGLLGDVVDKSKPIPSRIEGVFCRGEIEDAAELGMWSRDFVEAFTSLPNTTQVTKSASGSRGGDSGRKLRANLFLKTRSLRDKQREALWARSLLSEERMGDEGYCYKVVRDLIFVASSSNSFSAMLSDETVRSVKDDEQLRHCLLALVVDLSMQPEICFLGAYHQIQPLNALASNVVQGGNTSSSTGASSLGFPFYDVGLDGENQVVAVSDTGLDVDNCYMWDADRKVPRDKSGTVDSTVRKVVQYFAFVDSGDSLSGHGTHVAGTIAGRRATDGRTESTGQADGVARAAKLAFYDLGGTLTGQMQVPPMDSLLNEGYKAEARIHSASWGQPDQNRYTTMDSNLDSFMYNNQDFLFVVAAGNVGHGNRPSSITSPATCKNGLTVGATQNLSPHTPLGRRGPDYLVDFSSRGPTADGRRKPDVVAPGSYILSARAVPGAVGECDNTIPEGLVFNRGTSMAAPIVSGTAALIRQYFAEGWHGDGSRNSAKGYSARASLVKAVLLNGGQALEGVETDGGAITPSIPYDRSQGFGRINLLKSLPLRWKNNLNAIFINDKIITEGESDIISVLPLEHCEDPLSAMLVWTDMPGAPFCNEGCILNDLDLYVTQGGKQRIYPNGLSGPDSINNAERVQIQKPETDQIYNIHVEGTSVLGILSYSLVITGCFVEAGEGGSSNNGYPTKSTTNDCLDGKDVESIDEQSKTCAWLAVNLATYGHLCDYFDFFMKCPRTCSRCRFNHDDDTTYGAAPKSDESIAPLGVDGQTRWYGNQFNIEAKSRLVIYGFDVHIIKAGSYNIKVMTKAGTNGNGGGGDSGGGSDWLQMCAGTVSSSGYGTTTRISDSDCSKVTMEKNTSRTFWVTLGAPDLVMSAKQNDKSIIFDGQDIRVYSGAAITFFNLDSFDGYSFNGAIRYTPKKEGLDNDGNEVCQDQPEDVLIPSIGERSCKWIAENKKVYLSMCEFISIAKHCKAACGLCGKSY